MKRSIVLIILVLITSAYAHPGWGIAVDSKGSIYFTDIINRTIWKVDSNNAPEAFLTGVWSHSIYIDKNDNLYFENEEFEIGNGWISLKKVSPDKNVKYLIKPTKYGDGFNSPNFASDILGNIYYSIRDTLFKRDESGVSKPILTTGLNNPYYFSMQKDGRIYFVDTDGIKKFLPNDKLEIVAANLTIENPTDNPYPNEKRDIFNRIYGITLDDEGNIYYAYHGNSRVYRINPTGTINEIYYSKGNWYPVGLTWFDDTLYILEEGHSADSGPQAIRIQGLNKNDSPKVLTQVGDIRTR